MTASIPRVTGTEAFDLKDILTNAVFGIISLPRYLMQQKGKGFAGIRGICEHYLRLQVPVEVKRQQYFNQVDEWLEENVIIGSSTPLDDISIKASLIMSIEANPAFEPIREEEQFKKLIKKLKEKLG